MNYYEVQLCDSVDFNCYMIKNMTYSKSCIRGSVTIRGCSVLKRGPGLSPLLWPPTVSCNPPHQHLVICFRNCYYCCTDWCNPTLIIWYGKCIPWKYGRTPITMCPPYYWHIPTPLPHPPTNFPGSILPVTTLKLISSKYPLSYQNLLVPITRI